MQKFSILAIAAMFMIGVASCNSSKSKARLSAEIDSVSYLFGAYNGHGLKMQSKSLPGEALNMEALIAGFTDAARGDTSYLGKTDQDVLNYLNNYFMKAQQQQAQVTKEEGEKFLAENKTKSGVITTESGLQYKVITEGTGIKPTAEDTVKVHYTGKYLDGETFDSSVDRGEPAKFPVGAVIPGWVEGIQLMPTGSKYIFWIPSNLGYGETGNQVIKPNTALMFEVELLEVLKKKN
jgi:FKBP-type peptidyl-prolyl cis-trans isomerase FkpA/FKBP-type peptidyl-prolyl cis-trans isomerase FklB